ncbi:RagB/SusD family nutrient uptake outer membrane protein [Chitinophaga sp.]|uniref:RagB/SusD family nutrient uptake outer membrane protein n=1 Tax=Chitinophaga sp. TaxID=1869181 RepID=UPI002F952E0A
MKKILTILLVSVSLISCRKFLEEYSPSDVTPKSTADFAEILLMDGYPDNLKLMHPWLTFLDDDVQCYLGTFNEMEAPGFLAYSKNIYQWQSSLSYDNANAIKPDETNAWGNYYKLLLGTNVVLEYADKSIGSQAEKDQLKGEAFGLRAFYHFMLVNLYARPYNDSLTTPDKSPGIPIRLTSALSDARPQRNSVKEVYQQIVADLDSSIALLSLSKAMNNKLRLNHVAVHLLASRVYLYMENWQKSIEHADMVIRYHPQLMNYNNWENALPDLGNMLEGPTNIESLWNYGNYLEHYPYVSGGYGTYFEVSHHLFNCFEENDLRKTVAITEIPAYLKEYVALDYKQNKHLPSGIEGEKGATNSWRSSEAYLNRAEAYIQLYKTKGDGAAAMEALKSLNTLREQRFQSSTFQPWGLQPAPILLDMCRKERRRELFGEEAHRWFDLRRYGMPEIKHIFMTSVVNSETYTLRKRDPQYILPIPEDVITQNPALTRNPAIAGERQPD